MGISYLIYLSFATRQFPTWGEVADSGRVSVLKSNENRDLVPDTGRIDLHKLYDPCDLKHMRTRRRIAFSAVGQIEDLRNEAAFHDADEDVFEDGNGKSENLDHVLQRRSTKFQLITM